jgi:hypothetical protein
MCGNRDSPPSIAKRNKTSRKKASLRQGDQEKGLRYWLNKASIIAAASNHLVLQIQIVVEILFLLHKANCPEKRVVEFRKQIMMHINVWLYKED